MLTRVLVSVVGQRRGKRGVKKAAVRDASRDGRKAKRARRGRGSSTSDSSAGK